ncbi:recombinase family protein, partial [Nesterenkonia massiliensis]
MPTTTTTSQASAAASAAAPRAPAGKAVIYLRVSTMRQATKGGEAEGCSIPAQRAACHQKAKDLGLDVVEEFVDAGQSARSADRPELHAMLSRIKQGDISTLIVHKSDRLARSLEDHVAIVGSLKKKGVALVSCMEIMDADTPSGILTQGIMAAFNEFYSSNLSFEAKKGMRQKAQNGGTPGKVPIGYLNITSSEGGKDIRTVAVDEERA